MTRPYFVRVPFEGDNTVELVQFVDGGGHIERKFGITKARQAMAYYARNDIEIDGAVICKEMEVSDEVEGDKPRPDQVTVPSVDLAPERLEQLIDGAILINGEPLPEDYKIDAFDGKF